jgi:hypothetical protein
VVNSSAAYIVAAAEVFAALIMLVVSLRTTHLRWPVTVALVIGLLGGAALTLVLDRAL